MIVKNKLHRRISDSIVSLFSCLDESSEGTDEGDDYEGTSDELRAALDELDRDMDEMSESESEEQG